MTRRILGRSDFFAFFLAWWSGVFAGGFGEIGVSAWCFCGHVVVKRVAKTVCWMACFGDGFFAIFSDLFLWCFTRQPHGRDLHFLSGYRYSSGYGP